MYSRRCILLTVSSVFIVWIVVLVYLQNTMDSMTVGSSRREGEVAAITSALREAALANSQLKESLNSVTSASEKCESNLKNALALIDNNFETTKNLYPANMKIYVYEMPDEFTVDPLRNNRKCSHRAPQSWQTKYSAEVLLHETLIKSPLRTLDANEATFFYVPVYACCFLHGRATNFVLGNEFISRALHHIQSKFPFWDKRQGRDHIWTLTHDIGACLAPLDVVRNSILLMSTGDVMNHGKDLEQYVSQYSTAYARLHKFDNCFSPWKDIPIPPMIHSSYIQELRKGDGGDGGKGGEILASFRGATLSHPVYSRGIRQRWIDDFTNDTVIKVTDSHPSNEHSNPQEYVKAYMMEMRQSKFCLCPPGWASWTPRLFESIFAGCVPVLVTDGNMVPFESDFPPQTYSIHIPERSSSAQLKSILLSVSEQEYNRLKEAGSRMYDTFNYYSTEGGGGAVHNILLQLGKRMKMM